MASVGVLGAGISGLTAAFRLQQNDVSVRVFEASDRTGGVIRSEETEGFLVEHGPNSIRAGSATMETLIDDLRLGDKRVWANDASDTRYVVREGNPHPLPRSIGSFLSTDLFSTRAKLRLLAEPFMKEAPEGADESIATFTRRRLGQEVLDYAVAPFVGGVYAGSPEELSVQHALPRLATLERDHGSLFLGAVKRALTGPSNDQENQANLPSGLFSFEGGLQTLPEALAVELGDRIRTDSRVTSLSQEESHWQVTATPASGTSQTHSFDALICTVPLHQLTEINVDIPVDLAPLSNVWYPPLDVLALGYPRGAIEHPERIRDGFGMLIPPREEHVTILGTLFSSTLFPNRAPEDHVLLTTFVGGARAPDVATTDTAHLQALVERDLDRLLGVHGDPSFRRHVHWPNALPQYTVGYGRVKDTLDRIERRHPRLAFAGNYRQGVSVGDALTSGDEAATRILDRLNER